MATDIERLVVSLEASITKYERAMNKALVQTNATAKKIEERFDKIKFSLEGSFNGLAGVIGSAFAGAAALRGAQQLIDASVRIKNALKVSGLEGEDLTRVYDQLYASAQRNAVPLESLVQLYGRASLSAKELGVSQERLVKFADNVGLALRVSGQSSEEASGALTQLSQLLGSGTVRAEEFNSVQEGALPVLQAVANGMKQAGGSVAKLRALVIEGKISSKAFFDAYEAGAPILQEKVAGSVLTISQAFENLKTSLIDAAGNFDTATGASSLTGEALATLATHVKEIGDFFRENQAPISDFVGKLIELNDLINRIPGIDKVINPIGAIAGAGSDLSDLADQLRSASDGSDALAVSLDNTQQALADFIDQALTAGSTGSVLYTPEQEKALTKLGRDLVAGKGDIRAIKDEIMDLASKNIDFKNFAAQFDPLLAKIAQVGAAISTVNVAGAQASFAGQDTSGARITPIDITKPGYAPSKPSGNRSKAKSSGEKFSDTLEEQQRRIDNLKAETALQATLSPLVEDYGYAMEKLRVQQDLENQAAKAGLELTPDRKQAIADLAEGYASATVEAAKLTEAQDLARQSMADWFDLGKSATRGFIDDLAEGKTAAEALGNAFQQLGSKLLDLGLDSLFGTGSGGSPFGLLGQLFKIPGRASGGAVTAGQPYVVGEKRPELFVPSQSGTIIPKIPSIAGLGGGGVSAPVSIVIDATGADAAGLARLQAQLAQLKAELPMTVVGAVRTAKQQGKLK